jgi:hypothetical protein
MKFNFGAVAAVLFLALAARAQTTAFTYQGQLNSNSVPISGAFDFRFKIYNASSVVVGKPLTNAPVGVTNGLFTVPLDFGTGIFDGSTRTLEIGVRTNGDTNAYIVLAPRQTLTSVPYAIQALNASNAVALTAPLWATNLAGTIPNSLLSPNVAILTNNVFFSGTVTAADFAGNGAGLTGLNPGAMGNVFTPVYSINHLDTNFLVVVNNPITSENGTNTWNAAIGAWTNGTTVVGSPDGYSWYIGTCDFASLPWIGDDGILVTGNGFISDLQNTTWFTGLKTYFLTNNSVVNIVTNYVATHATLADAATTATTANFVAAISPNASATNLTSYPTDQQALNEVSTIGEGRFTEGIVLDNPNMKPYIAFASCLNRMQSGQLTVVVIGDSMSWPGRYNSIPVDVIGLLNNTYGWVGDYCFQVDQNGAFFAQSRPTFESYWFGVGAGEIDQPDNGGNLGSYTQGVLPGGGEQAYTTKVWAANYTSLLYISQPLGGVSSWNDRIYPGPINGTSHSVNTYSAAPTINTTNWPITLNSYPQYHTVYQSSFTITGTNVYIGAGFENTNATGVRTYWLGGNSYVAGGGSASLSNFLSPGINLLHQFAAKVRPDMILYCAKDYGENGATNLENMTHSLSILLSKDVGLAWSNTKVFVISTPNVSGAYPPNSTTTNNAALRLAAEANGWSYIPLQEDFSGSLEGVGGLGDDPQNPTTGIIGSDGVHPTRWGAYVMALDVLSQLHVPLKFDPAFDNPNIWHQQFGKTFFPGSGVTTTNSLGATGWTNSFTVNATAYTTAAEATLYNESGTALMTFGAITTTPISLHPGWYITGTTVSGTAIAQ